MRRVEPQVVAAQRVGDGEEHHEGREHEVARRDLASARTGDADPDDDAESLRRADPAADQESACSERHAVSAPAEIPGAVVGEVNDAGSPIWRRAASRPTSAPAASCSLIAAGASIW